MSAKRVERLEKTLARVAREQGLDQERLRRWVSFLALCGVLEQAVERGVIDTYYLKGGVAMELRFARAARTTKDFDLALEGNRAERIRRLGDVLQLEFDAFTFRLKPEMHEMELAETVRVEVAVQYKTRAWQTVEIDLGPGDAQEVDLVEPAITGLTAMGLAMAPHVRCLASTSRWRNSCMLARAAAGGPRARDVLDILLVNVLGKLDHVRTRAAAQRIFAERGTHSFPPSSALPPAWRRELENLAQELGYPTRNAEGIEGEFAALLDAIAKG